MMVLMVDGDKLRINILLGCRVGKPTKIAHSRFISVMEELELVAEFCQEYFRCTGRELTYIFPRALKCPLLAIYKSRCRCIISERHFPYIILTLAYGTSAFFLQQPKYYLCGNLQILQLQPSLYKKRLRIALVNL